MKERMRCKRCALGCGTCINKIAFYTDKDGCVQTKPQRKMLIVADMIISGEKEGPVMPSSKNVGMIASGVNPVCFDEAITVLMGFKKERIPTLRTARNVRGRFPLVDKDAFPEYHSNSKKYDGLFPEQILSSDRLNFIPTNGWKGHIETQ